MQMMINFSSLLEKNSFGASALSHPASLGQRTGKLDARDSTTRPRQ